MGQAQSYTIHFTYEIVEDAMKFPLQATVTRMADNSYLVEDIRHMGQPSDMLIPHISLMRHAGGWIYIHGRKTTALSRAIGQAIDKHEHATPSL